MYLLLLRGLALLLPRSRPALLQLERLELLARRYVLRGFDVTPMDVSIGGQECPGRPHVAATVCHNGANVAQADVQHLLLQPLLGALATLPGPACVPTLKVNDLPKAEHQEVEHDLAIGARGAIVEQVPRTITHEGLRLQLWDLGVQARLQDIEVATTKGVLQLLAAEAGGDEGQQHFLTMLTVQGCV